MGRVVVLDQKLRTNNNYICAPPLEHGEILTWACPCGVKATGALRPGTTPAGSFISPVGWMAAPFQFSGVVGWYSGAPNGGKAAPGPNSGGSLN